MADVTELRCWPACVDAIDWSQDGTIALASDERVELIFPHTVTAEGDRGSASWQHVTLKVPLFTHEELPNKNVAPLVHYSVGEEISSSSPIDIAWSSAGLGRHRRCALAVLTSNLVLSIWSADGNPQEESSWSRRLIINTAIQNHFDIKTPGSSSSLISTPDERQRLRSRVRAFTWAPPVSNPKTGSVIGVPLAHDQHIIAITNDANEVALVRVHSPTTELGATPDWDAEVMKLFTIGSESASTLNGSRRFEDMMEQQNFINSIAWSPWINYQGCLQAVIAYATNEEVRARIVKLRYGIIEVGAELVYVKATIRSHGPLTWSSRVDDGNLLHLALFTSSNLAYIVVSGQDASIVATRNHDLDMRWDQISGVCWDNAASPTQRLHFGSLLSTLQSATTVLEIGNGEFRSLESPNWRDQMENNLVLFSVKNDLKGNSRAKLWGLAISPLGDFIAACNSVHPSDMIEYGIPADRHATIAISTLRQYSSMRLVVPSRDVSAECLMFTLKKISANSIEDASAMPAFADEMVEKLLETYPPPQQPDACPDSCKTMMLDFWKPGEIRQLVHDLKINAVLNHQTLRDRYTLLVARACNMEASGDILRTLIAYRLADATQALPVQLSQSPFSAEISMQHRQVLELVHKVVRTKDTCLDADFGGVATVKTTEEALATGNSDTCDFCSAAIPFTDLWSGACINGHQFPRCGLSFITIQAPGITKYCGICKTPFLNDEFVSAQEDPPHATANFNNAEEVQAFSVGQVITTVTTIDDVAMDGQSEMIHMSELQDNGDASQLPARNSLASKSAELAPSNPPVTLSQVIFQACDMCIYCGGKFVE
ncbi:hypothetical protein ACN47E_010321 [Coniothyrium glycines]